MVRETENLPHDAKSRYMCLRCGSIFEISEIMLGENDLPMCPICGNVILMKVRPKTRKIILGV
ncbi:MAG: DNA-directed RNA polymerase subunit P [Candidatus Njordarchaeia archaeon]